jgi:glycosyltransferase involved in cell wall biosynthesis
MRVSVVVRCFNEEAHIGRLLTGVRRQRRQPEQIVVVDSGSTDATLAIAEQFDVEIVSIEPKDFSFGRALNIGLAAADCDVAILASAHVYPVYDSWIERLIAPFEDPSVALAYGQQRAPTTASYSEQQILKRWFPSRSEQPQRHPFCNNANAAIRRSVWLDLPYDERLTGLEDLAWAKRALDRGHVLAYVADAPIIHVHDESFGEVVNRYRREAIAHKEIYPEQHLKGATAVRLGLFNIAQDLRAARGERRLAENAVDILRFRTAQFLGTHRGFTQAGPVPEALRRRFYYPAELTDEAPALDDDLADRRIDYDEPR